MYGKAQQPRAEDVRAIVDLTALVALPRQSQATSTSLVKQNSEHPSALIVHAVLMAVRKCGGAHALLHHVCVLLAQLLKIWKGDRWRQVGGGDEPGGSEQGGGTGLGKAGEWAAAGGGGGGGLQCASGLPIGQLMFVDLLHHLAGALTLIAGLEHDWRVVSGVLGL